MLPNQLKVNVIAKNEVLGSRGGVAAIASDSTQAAHPSTRGNGWIGVQTDIRSHGTYLGEGAVIVRHAQQA